MPSNPPYDDDWNETALGKPQDESADMHEVARNLTLHIKNIQDFPIDNAAKLHRFLYCALTTPFPSTLQFCEHVAEIWPEVYACELQEGHKGPPHQKGSRRWTYQPVNNKDGIVVWLDPAAGPQEHEKICECTHPDSDHQEGDEDGDGRICRSGCPCIEFTPVEDAPQPSSRPSKAVAVPPAQEDEPERVSDEQMVRLVHRHAVCVFRSDMGRMVVYASRRSRKILGKGFAAEEAWHDAAQHSSVARAALAPVTAQEEK
jgi:hypothetical protein